MTSFIYQSLFIGCAIAGVWLADFSLPTKLILSGLTGSAYVAIQYQIIGSALRAIEAMSLIEARLRVIQIEVERLQKNQPSLEPATSVVAAQIEQEARAKDFQARINRLSSNDTLHVAVAIASAVVVAIAVVAVIRQSVA